MSSRRRFFTGPFGLAVLACLALTGWALWSGGILDGPLAKQVRSSSVYAAPGVELDQAAAERIIGNRRLVVAILEPGADLSAACDSVERAADGNVALLLSRDDEEGDEFDNYGCALLPNRDDENFGKAFVAEMAISRGVDQFVDRPLEALKVAAVNYDLLVKAGTVPDGARTVSPSLPRYLIAGAAIGAVVFGAAAIYVGAHRAGKAAATRRRRREETADARSSLSSGAAVLAQQIIDLDGLYNRLTRRAKSNVTAAQRSFGKRYRKLVSDYAELLDVIATADVPDAAESVELTRQVESLSRRCRSLAESKAARAVG